MEVESYHSMVEEFSRNVKISLRSEWEVAACMACKDSYAVTSMEHEEIKDMKELFKFLEIKNVTVTTETKYIL
jgi:adenylosuccinate lyase